jgi:2-oxoglutarate ferredoxin oxidoreductase subunit beta
MSNNGQAKKLTKKDFASDQDVRWCPGCGDYAILAAVQKTLADLGVKREEAVFISGIGCSSRFPYYMNTFGFHSIHGRAPAIATGFKLARPELSVWVITGDGDGLSIGGNHLLHALRRNVNLNIILFNNRIYGLTKGQYSPTSNAGTRTPSTPFGSIDYPVNPVSFALGSGATFVARAIDVDAKSLGPILQRAYHHKGASIIEVLQNCPVFNDGVWDSVTDKKTAAEHQLRLEDGKPLVFANGTRGIRMRPDLTPEIVDVGDGDDQVPLSEILVHREAAATPYHFLLSQLPEGSFPQPLGVLRCVDTPSYDNLVTQQVEQTVADRGPGQLDKLLHEGMTWEIGEDGKPIA